MPPACLVLRLTFLTLLTRLTAGTSYEEYLENERSRRPLDATIDDLPGMTCELNSNSSCPAGQCCVKEVISYLDLDKDMEVRTKCLPHRSVGELCLRQTEGYLCECGLGLLCAFQNNETYGHCQPMPLVEDKLQQSGEKGMRSP